MDKITIIFVTTKVIGVSKITRDLHFIFNEDKLTHFSLLDPVITKCKQKRKLRRV